MFVDICRTKTLVKILQVFYYCLERKKMESMENYTQDEIRSFISDIRLLITDTEQSLNDENVLSKIEEYVFTIKKSHCCNHRENIALIQRIFLSLRREMDILQPYIEDKSISEIMVNGKDDIFAECQGKIIRLPVSFDTTEDLEELIRRISARVRKEINELNPIVDARLSDGSRVNAVYKNIALNGPILTIRKFPEKVMEMKDLIDNETLTEEIAEALQILVKAGYNCFVC